MSEALRLADKLEDMTCLWSPSDNRDLVNTSAAELRRLHAENEALRADAERYRWLRNFQSRRGAARIVNSAPHIMDDAIDAARKEST